MKKTLKYLLYYPLVAVLWLVAVAAALELLALATELFREHHNPLIAAYKNHQPLPDSGRAMIPPSDAPAPDPMDRGGGVDPLDFTGDAFLPQLLEWGPRDIHLPPEEQQERRLLFGKMSPLAREAYAQLNGEVVLETDAQFHVLNLYGFFKSMLNAIPKGLIRQMLLRTDALDSLRAAVAQTLADGQARFSAVTSADGDPLKFVCIPAPGEEGRAPSVYVFFEFHPELAAPQKAYREDSSRWAVYSYRYKPNYYSEVHHMQLTNELGFYDDSVQLPKPENTFRIVCVGASTTEEGITKEETYPALLEKHLRESMPGCAIEVLNAGTPGTFAYTHLLRFNDYAALQPDLFILHLGVNDTLFQYAGPVVSLLPRLSRFVRIFCPGLAAPDAESFARQHYVNMGFALELFIQLAQRRGIAVAIASIAFPDPDKITRNETQYFVCNANSEWRMPAFDLSAYASYITASNRILLRIAGKYGLHYLPIAERLTGGTEVFTDFCHMTQAGIVRKAGVFHEYLAPVLAPLLAEKYCRDAENGGQPGPRS